MKEQRKKLINRLFNWTMTFYCRFKKKEAWGITAAQLVAMPANSFGHHLGVLLQINGFELIPKVERHDAYHLLTGYTTTVEDEIALQYCCFGNGKRTPYLLGVLIVGTLLLPEYFPKYIRGYYYGKNSNSFHHFDFKKILQLDFEDFRQAIFTKTQLALHLH